MKIENQKSEILNQKSISAYGYELPPELIARYPEKNRDESRLMAVDPVRQKIEEWGIFRELPNHLESGDLLVLNDTRVIKARLRGRRSTGGAVEVLVLDFKGSTGEPTMNRQACVRALVRPLTKLRIGEMIFFGVDHPDGGTSARLVRKLPDGPAELDFGEASISETLEKYGAVPLPPYIKRPAEALDEERYQTVVASRPGAVAAPTAGLHFTTELLRRIEQKGVGIAYVTLHVGYGTFAPVEPDQTRLHAEKYSISAESLDAIASARCNRGRIIAVGTTVVRALESWAITGDASGETDIFIKPGFQFRIVDSMITNFHLPGSSLLALVHAFAGDILFDAYRMACFNRYRFFSYGDAMFIGQSKA